MKKIQLVDELEKRFVIKNNQLFLKPSEQQQKKTDHTRSHRQIRVTTTSTKSISKYTTTSTKSISKYTTVK